MTLLLNTMILIFAGLELVKISNDTSSLLGDTALLSCVGHGQPYVLITWSRNGVNITNNSRVTINETEVTQGGRLLKQSFLELYSVEFSDAGNYTCTLSNGRATTNATSKLIVLGKKTLCDITLPVKYVIIVEQTSSME